MVEKERAEKARKERSIKNPQLRKASEASHKFVCSPSARETRLKTMETY